MGANGTAYASQVCPGFTDLTRSGRTPAASDSCPRPLRAYGPSVVLDGIRADTSAPLALAVAKFFAACSCERARGKRS